MPTVASRPEIEEDFDAIALLTREVPERLGPHEGWLLRNLPSSRATVLEMRSLRLLAAGEKITRVAFDLGYSTPSAFIAMFRKALGTTPRQYFAESG
jgi:hypothetical protein